MKPLLPIVLLGLLMSGGEVDPPAELNERVRHNARERTSEGLTELQAEESEQALQSFESAARLAPDAPLTRFNDGAARLLAGAPDAATRLEQLVEIAPNDLLPAAYYNLGNARLQDGDASGAVEAYKNTLRRDPNYEDAKFNLELALQAEQQSESEPSSDDSPSSEDESGQQKPEAGDSEQSDSPEESSQPESSDQESEEPENPEDTESPSSPEEDESPGAQPPSNPLPDYEDQPEMSAEQAAALLQAVEDLEREQRKAAASEASRRSAGKGKDW